MFIGINRFLANWIFNVLGLVFEGLFRATLSQAQGEVYTYSLGRVNPLMKLILISALKPRTTPKTA
jgi:hypothetical protein